MSNKEAAIELIQKLPDDISVQGILSVLQQNLGAKPTVSDSPVDTDEWSADEMTEEEWRQFVAWGLRDELNDPREDIYTLEDGEPVDGPR